MVIIWSIVQAVVVRCLLFAHSFLCIWRTVDIQKSNLFWLLGLGNILHIVELEHRILKKRGQEDKWFCMCNFIHLLNTVPSIWLLEFDRLNRHQLSTATTTGNTSSATSNNTNDLNQDESLSSIEGITLPVKLNADTWVSVLEQGFLFILVLGRWILPRGKLSRNQLSQLLFVYIGSGSDVMELFIIFEEPDIRLDKAFSYGILAVWTLSLLQFTLVLTSTRKPRGGLTDIDNEETPNHSKKPRSKCCAKMVEMEIWSLFASMILQDGPYLTIRLCAIFVKGVISYGILFFACKNILMVMMLFYRCVVVFTHKEGQEEKSKKKWEENSKDRPKWEENSKDRPNIKGIKEQNDTKSKDKKIYPKKKHDKYSRNHRRSFSDSPPNYWSNSDYRFPGYGFPRTNYGYGYY